MDLTTLGTLLTIIYLVAIFIFQWVTDWYFNVKESSFLDFCYFLYVYHKKNGKVTAEDNKKFLEGPLNNP